MPRRRHAGFDRESAFSAGFDLALRVAAIITNDPCGPIGPAIDAQIAKTASWLGIVEDASFITTPASDFNAGTATDLRATKKATVEARRFLGERLPKVAEHLHRQADVISAAHADLDGDLTEARDVFDALINPSGVVGEDAVHNVSVAIGLLRGTTYIAKNGDTSLYEGADE